MLLERSVTSRDDTGTSASLEAAMRIVGMSESSTCSTVMPRLRAMVPNAAATSVMRKVGLASACWMRHAMVQSSVAAASVAACPSTWMMWGCADLGGGAAHHLVVAEVGDGLDHPLQQGPSQAAGDLPRARRVPPRSSATERGSHAAFTSAMPA